MKRVCTNCGREFESSHSRQTCSTRCAIARQRQAIREMREKSGEIYERWKKYSSIGREVRIARMSQKKGGEK